MKTDDTPLFWAACAASVWLFACGNDDGGDDSGTGGMDGAGATAGAGAAAGSTGASAGTGGSAGASTLTGFPEDTSSDGVQAYLENESYQGDGWNAQTENPRDSIDPVSPHGRVRVWMNDTLVESLLAGNAAGIDSTPHDQLSMAVKEMYDDADTLVGRASMFKIDPGDAGDAWGYFCVGPAGRCINGEPEFTADAPLYSRERFAGCGFCHGGLVFSDAP